MASDLSHLDDDRIRLALARVRRESTSQNGYAPKLIIGDVIRAAGVVLGQEAQTVEAVAAWDAAVHIADTFARQTETGWELRRHVKPADPACPQCEGSGMTFYTKDGHRFAADCRCKQITPIPGVAPRLADTVARLGGWGKLKGIPAEAYTFRRRDFIAEYLRAPNVERHVALAAGNRSGDLSRVQAGNLLDVPDGG